MAYLPLAAAAIIGTLGLIHLIYTLRDLLSRPRYFAPRDPVLLEAMRGTQIAVAPNGHDYWSVLLGIHLTHGIGLLLFALLIALTVITPLPALKLLMIGLGLVLTFIAWRFFFHIPLIGCAIATALMIAGWLL
ncbi:hypothetical protein [Bradyrhizobium sp. LHD-71]|uniref:LIC_13387 family protein n=1 Tax=Bradyrhizobium sp. LHD-71 TaxID=3072141 RepID=UPI00280DC0DD|nr:hypothetical protein [Bradyrhizobium sp. LHD-71]MDQ8729059.1 hypothetical protein [Bradyrhizobium sp. LHD-71]